MHCVVSGCDLVFGSDLFAFVLLHTPDCNLSPGRESENMRDDEVCVCVFDGRVHVEVVSHGHSSDSASVMGWRG